MIRTLSSAALALAALSSLAIAQPSAANPAPYEPPAALAPAIEAIVARPNVAGLGLAVIEDGAVVWTGYYGEQAPGVPVSEETVFNTASVAKTMIAETVLRLVEQGRMSLDDPIADHFRHPDLADDPRYDELTPRIILSHQTGLLNWPYLYDDGRLAFVSDPGAGTITYSGAGIRILALYLERRFDTRYPDLVREVLFTPLGIEGMDVARRPWMEGRTIAPRDGEGQSYPPFTRQASGAMIEPGEWSAADNLFSTVPAYAHFLTRLIAGDNVGPDLTAERRRLHSASGDPELGYDCLMPEAECPDPLGYGLGWTLFGEPGRMVLNHGGNDFGEHAQVYFAPETGDGLVLFMSGGNAFRHGLEILEIIDPDLRMAHHYRALFDHLTSQQD